MREKVCALLVVLGLLTSMSSASTSNPYDFSGIGPSGAQVAGAIVGAAVVIAVVVYLAVPKQKTIEGCVSSTDHGVELTRDGDHTRYALTGESNTLQPGTRVKLKGKRHKKHDGVRDFEVRKVVKQEGSCTAAVPAS